MSRPQRGLTGLIALLPISGVVAVLAVPLYGVQSDTTGRSG